MAVCFRGGAVFRRVHRARCVSARRRPVLLTSLVPHGSVRGRRAAGHSGRLQRRAASRRRGQESPARPGQPGAERHVGLWLCQDGEASVTGSLVAHALLAAVTSAGWPGAAAVSWRGLLGRCCVHLPAGGLSETRAGGPCGPSGQNPVLPLKWRSVLKENLKARELCAPGL